MTIPVTFIQSDGADHFVVPVHVVNSGAAALAHHPVDAPTGQITFPEVVRDRLVELARHSWSVQLPHRRYRRRQRARLRLSFS